MSELNDINEYDNLLYAKAINLAVICTNYYMREVMRKQARINKWGDAIMY